MIDRAYFNGPIVVRCDACTHGCCETHSKDFAGALAAAKDDGWVARHMGGDRGWAHFCADCAPGRPWEREGAVRPAAGGRRA
jgi:hypothetical protein